MHEGVGVWLIVGPAFNFLDGEQSQSTKHLVGEGQRLQGRPTAVH